MFYSAYIHSKKYDLHPLINEMLTELFPLNKPEIEITQEIIDDFFLCFGQGNSCIVASNNSEAKGILIYKKRNDSHNFFVCEIKLIYISRFYRGKGISAKLREFASSIQ